MSIVYLSLLVSATILANPAAAPNPLERADAPPAKPSTLFRENPPEAPPAERPPKRPPERPADRPVNPPAAPRPAGPALPPPARLTTGPRHPVPDPAEQARALQLLRELFADEYRQADTSPAAAVELRNELLRQSQTMRRRTSADDITSRYVLLTEAISLAVSTRDFATALNVARDLADHYDIDGRALRLDLVARATREETDPVKLEPVVRAVVDLSDDAVSQGDLPGAGAILNQADALARRTKNVSMATEVQRRRRELRELQAQFRNLAESVEALRRQGDDPAANLVVGRYRCLVVGDFASGLPLLAKGSDAHLRGLASRDLRGAPAPDTRADLADAWWDLAEQHTGRARDHLRARAAHWYRQVLADLGGLKRMQAEKRIAAAPVPTPDPSAPTASPPTRTTASPPVVITGGPPGPVPDATAVEPNLPPGPTQPADRLLQLLATRFPADARPVPGEQWDSAKATQWLKTNLRPGTPVSAKVELAHAGTLQRHPQTKKPHVYVTFRVASPFEHDGIRHTLDISARLEDQKALDAMTIAQGQRGEISGTVTDLRLGGWSGNKQRGLGTITFLLMLDNVAFAPEDQ